MITLRPAREADIPDIVAACQDPESVRWTTVPEPYTLGDATGFVNDYVPQRWLLGRGAIFVVAGPDDRYAGSMDLRLLAPTIGDVGYLVAPWARGHGYASAALRTLCEWGFRDLGLHRVEWRAYLGNHASRAVAEKAGFTVEGVGRAVCVQRGEYRDAWLGARLRTDPEPKELT
jgi:RimJ/RimL family protein N-acetyltransferase